MKAEELKANFAKNIKYLRNSKHLSQEKLGKDLGYSDKSISKWECGDVLPDVTTLNLIADYFSITLNDLMSNDTRVPHNRNLRHLVTAFIPLIGILSLAGLLFFLFSSFTQMTNPWLFYVLSFPCYFIVMIVLSSIFFSYKMILLSVSLLSWSIAASIFLIFLGQNFWFLFVIAASLQAFYFLLGVTIYIYKKNKKLKN